jgi:ferritin-like metal-binding protein YciE
MATTSTMTSADNKTYLDWLRDAHAMEQHAEQMLEKTASRIENYPEMKARIERHIEQTRGQADRLKRCIERHDSSTSAFKDVAAKVMGFGQTLSGLFVSDEVVKAAAASYAFEQMEIATYKVLIAAAEDNGDLETKRVCEQNLREEEEMADFIDRQLPAITHKFLAREAAGETAKH